MASGCPAPAYGPGWARYAELFTYDDESETFAFGDAA